MQLVQHRVQGGSTRLKQHLASGYPNVPMSKMHIRGPTADDEAIHCFHRSGEDFKVGGGG